MRSIYIAAVFGVGCTTTPRPRLDAIAPSTVGVGESPSAVLTGDNLFASARVDADDHRSAELEQWQVEIDDHSLNASTIDGRTISVAMIPSTLTVGAHDIVATSPSGEALTLSGALTITSALALNIQIPPVIECGAPFVATMTVRNGDAGAALHVTPTAMTATTGSLSSPTGPTPAAGDIAPGASASFAWTYPTPLICSGTITLQGGATGTDATSMTAIAAAPAGSNIGAVAAPSCDATACSAAGGTCSNGQCAIVTTTNTPIACPAGESCAITCQTDSTCRNGVDCSNAASCTIRCLGDHSCNSDTIRCAGAGCTIECLGDHSCDGANIDCSGTTCDYHYAGVGCGAHSCGAMGSPPCTCTGLGCMPEMTCP